LRALVVAIAAAAACTLGLAGPAASQTSVPGCTKSVLEAEFTVIPGSQGAGQVAYTLTIDNYGTSACTLDGLPKLRLLTKHGAKLPTHAATEPHGAYTVTLAAGQYAQALASFTPDIAASNEPGTHCEPVAHWLRLTLPAGGGTLLAPMSPTMVCQHGTMTFRRLKAVALTPNCAASGLGATFKAVGPPYGGQVTYALVLTNTGGASCLVDGDISLQLLSATGTALPTAINDLIGYPYVIAAGQSATLDATAYTKPSSTEPSSGPCEPVATQLAVTVPHATALTVPIDPPRSFCHGGRLSTTGLFLNG
jgi:hypothetical protein